MISSSYTKTAATVTDPPAATQMPGVAPSLASVEPAARFETIFTREVGYVWKTLERLGVPARDLEDVTHDVFVAVYRHLDDYDEGRPIRPWLCGFAYRVASDYRRLARNRYERVGDDTAMDAASVAPRHSELEARDLMLRALGAVALDRRVVLVMHDIDGCSAPDIASELGIPLNTVYSRLRVARRELRDAVLELGGDA
ncbi:MAG: RNA polymerase sigma factor [Myxococcales bacterium]|nr:RNA polymerase sigma factor [Myxococcales bacterium]MCB9579295.1 RNA polymerase sigma factor [Polyangiaceae bacterium]